MPYISAWSLTGNYMLKATLRDFWSKLQLPPKFQLALNISHPAYYPSSQIVNY
jgi:hypothetical protein